MVLLVILFLLVLVFDPSIALWLLVLGVLIYGGYFLIATVTDVAINSGHPIIIGIITVLCIVALIVIWFKKSCAFVDRNTCTINDKNFCLQIAAELVQQGKIDMAMQSIHNITGLAWVDAETLANQILQDGKVPSHFSPVHPMTEITHEKTTDYLKRGKENLRKMEEDRIARWIGEAKVNDCWYGGSSIIGPQTDYWSDGSIKRDRWTGIRYPKGLYFLDSQGYNAAVGLKIPPDAKKCPD